MINNNVSRNEINFKIVYYGPALSGKTTNLEHIYSNLPPESKGKMVSMKTRTDRTLFFDFLPLKVEKVKGTTIKFLIYTVPGQVYYNATRKLVLNGVDAVVFVADSDPGKMDENRQSMSNLKKNLSENGISISDIPMVVQYNKRDSEDCLSTEVLEKELNETGADYFEAVAVEGKGVYETFESIARKVFRKVKTDINPPAPADAERKEQPEKSAVEPEEIPESSISNQKISDSETDESESLKNSAEERKEEHKSVSEFVDEVLTEKDRSEDLEFDSTGENFEEYGHTVELDEADVRMEKAEAGPEVAVEFINDPLDHLDRKESEPVEEHAGEEAGGVAPEVIRVPVKVPTDRLQNGNISIILELELE